MAVQAMEKPREADGTAHSHAKRGCEAPTRGRRHCHRQRRNNVKKGHNGKQDCLEACAR
jgi:hypothetical protein